MNDYYYTLLEQLNRNAIKFKIQKVNAREWRVTSGNEPGKALTQRLYKNNMHFMVEEILKPLVLNKNNSIYTCHNQRPM